MDVPSGFSLYPSRRCKTIHLVRHAQGIHNVAGDKNHDAYFSYDYFDAHLTPLGWQQVDHLRKHAQETGLSKRIELVITSPLLRTMQTAVGVFGGEGNAEGIDVPPLMVENAGHSDRSAISSLNCPPFIAVELCREILVASDDDTWWKPDPRETRESVAKRGLEFINWLWTRKEKEIAVVSHSGILYYTLCALGNDCHSSIKSEICKRFANCELRSIVIVDKSMVSSDPATTNYPGKILNGLNLPGDVAAEKHPEKGISN